MCVHAQPRAEIPKPTQLCKFGAEGTGRAIGMETLSIGLPYECGSVFLFLVQRHHAASPTPSPKCRMSSCPNGCGEHRLLAEDLWMTVTTNVAFRVTFLFQRCEILSCSRARLLSHLVKWCVDFGRCGFDPDSPANPHHATTWLCTRIS